MGKAIRMVCGAALVPGGQSFLVLIPAQPEEIRAAPLVTRQHGVLRGQCAGTIRHPACDSTQPSFSCSSGSLCAEAPPIAGRARG